MAASTLDPDFVPHAGRQLLKGHDNHALGPGDSSDSGSDMTNLPAFADSDAEGTGERAAVERGRSVVAPESPDAVERIAVDQDNGDSLIASFQAQGEQLEDSVEQAQMDAKRDQDLDDALEDTFPASDPVNLTPEAPKTIARPPVKNAPARRNDTDTA